MRACQPSAANTFASLSLLVIAGCFGSGATPPGANAPCSSDDNCAAGYQCLPASAGGSGTFCCKDRNACGPSSSSDSGVPLDGAPADGPRQTDSRDIPGAGGAPLDAGTGGAGGGGIGGDGTGGGSGSGGTGGAIDAPLDAPPAQPDVPGSLPLGKACVAGVDCLTGNCVDGVCCDKPQSECAGCNACVNAATGLDDGTCGPVSVGKDPHDTCADETATKQCGNDGTCDGKGGCSKVSSSHVCTPGSCSADGKTYTEATTCDGKGACTTPTSKSCGAFQCAATGCLQTCTTQEECGNDYYCNTSAVPAVCAAKKVNGSPSTQGHECKSGVVADGVCCDKACSGCSACTLALNKQTGPSAANGQCLPVVAGEVGHGTCTATPPCGLDGKCDGNGACRYVAGGTSCAPDSCSGSTLTTSACVTATHTCVPTATACPNSTACAADGAGCGTKKVQGAACTSTADCAAGACVDNAAGTGKICCATACPGACQACAGDGSACTTKNVGAADPACGNATTCHTGTCAAGGTCQLSSAGTSCGTNLYCTAAGQCTCQGGGPCQPTNPCKTGIYSCTTGTQVCTESGNQPTTVNCGSGPSCSGTTKYLQQKCNGNGACAPQQTQACPSNQTCSGLDCACVSPYLTCGNTCLDPRTDPNNCGSCGRNCLGGSCASGLCQPAVVVSSVAPYSSIFGIDASYVYYSDCTDSYTCAASRVNKAAVSGAGTVLKSDVARGFGLIGNTMFLNRYRQTAFLCTIGGACDPSDPAIWVKDGGMFGSFKSPSPQYYSLIDPLGSSGTISWYSVSNTLVTTASVPSQASGASSGSAYGSSVYWIQNNVDDSGNPTGAVLYGTNGFPIATRSQLASVPMYKMGIVDVNAQSVILMHYDTSALHRVPLPAGLGTGTPQPITGNTGTNAVTEDSNGIYWIDTLGTFRKCSAPSCTNNVQLATNVAMSSVGGGLYQDASALYWVSSQGQLLRLAK